MIMIFWNSVLDPLLRSYFDGFLSLFFRYPSYPSFSPLTATSTYGKKSSSNLVTQLDGPRFSRFFHCKQSLLCPPSVSLCKKLIDETSNSEILYLRRDHQIEGSSKDRDKGDDVRGHIIPL